MYNIIIIIAIIYNISEQEVFNKELNNKLLENLRQIFREEFNNKPLEKNLVFSLVKEFNNKLTLNTFINNKDLIY